MKSEKPQLPIKIFTSHQILARLGSCVEKQRQQQQQQRREQRQKQLISETPPTPPPRLLRLPWQPLPLRKLFWRFAAFVAAVAAEAAEAVAVGESGWRGRP